MGLGVLWGCVRCSPWAGALSTALFREELPWWLGCDLIPAPGAVTAITDVSQVSAQLSLAALLPLLVHKDCPCWNRSPPESEQGNIVFSLVKTLQEPLSGSWSSAFLLSHVAFLH